MSKIKQIIAREILDSRGNPTVETKVFLENGVAASASVPSEDLTSYYGAHELRDNDKKRYNGFGVLKVVKNINSIISPRLVGMDVEKQEKIDDALIELDGTKDKKRLGSNAILSVSLVVARAAAISGKKELFQYLAKTFKFKACPRGGGDHGSKMPIPLFNIFNGGRHADTNLDFQEFLIVPLRHPASKAKKKFEKSFAETIRMGSEVFHELGHILNKTGFDTDTGCEGGYAPDIYSSIQAIEMIMAAIINAGYKPGIDAGLGIDIGAHGLFDKEKKQYIFKLDRTHFFKDNLIGLYEDWLKKFPVIYLEDGLAEDEWEGWRELTKELGKDMIIAGDELFSANIDRLRKGLKEKAANSILIKLNQVGTLSEAIKCIKLAQSHNYKVVISNCSDETCDDFIADLAVAVNAEYIKAGSLSRGERVAKYNRLMEIEGLIA